MTDQEVPINSSIVSDDQSVASTPSELSSTTREARSSKQPLPSLSFCLYGVEREYADPEDEHPLPVNLDKVPKDHVINLSQLRKIASQGLPGEEEDRGVAWRVLMGYLGTDPSEWSSTLSSQRGQYIQFVKEIFGDNQEAENGRALIGTRRFQPGQLPDEEREKYRQQPAAPSDSQQLPAQIQEQWKRQGRDLHVLEDLTRNWNALSIHGSAEDEEEENAAEEKDWDDTIESALLLDEIRKDVVRTHPDLRFYLEPNMDLGKRRYAALERILFVWSKYNKGVRYVQGMNEIVATIYYVLANDHNHAWATHAEADAYALFSILIADMRDVFCPDLDDADTGIQGRIATMQFLLDRHDPEVQEHLQECEIDATFYAVRWWTTLLSREFLLPDTIRLWDSMLASTHKDNFLRYVCVTMVLAIRDELLCGDMSACLRLLQRYPATNMEHLLESSRALWIYESQITLACHKGGISLHQALQTIKPPSAIIMAYGFRGGIVELSIDQQLEQAGEKAAASVREATSVMATQAREARNAVATQAQGLFGRASRMYTKYQKRHRTQSADSTSNVSKSDDEADGADDDKGVKSFDSGSASENVLPEPLPELTEDDKLYMDAILNA